MSARSPDLSSSSRQAEPSRARKRSKPTAQAALAPSPLAPGLYLVATPIGNLADISLRALDVLAKADLVACEDTRTTRKLLTAHGIAARLTAYHDHNAAPGPAQAHGTPGIWRRRGAGLGRGHAADFRSRLQTGRRRGRGEGHGDRGARRLGRPRRADRLGPALRSVLVRRLPAQQDRPPAPRAGRAGADSGQPGDLRIRAPPARRARRTWPRSWARARPQWRAS